MSYPINSHQTCIPVTVGNQPSQSQSRVSVVPATQINQFGQVVPGQRVPHNPTHVVAQGVFRPIPVPPPAPPVPLFQPGQPARVVLHMPMANHPQTTATRITRNAGHVIPGQRQ